MAWSATADAVDMRAYTIGLHFVEDTTGETFDEVVAIPAAPEPNWINLLVANKIVDLTRRTSVVTAIQPGPVIPDATVLSSANVTAAPPKLK